MGEEKARFIIFKNNLEHIRTENARGLSHTLGINHFADLELAEFKSIYMSAKPSDPLQMWEGAPYLGNHTYHGEELAWSVDWSQRGAVTPVKSQGHCGSCWIFSGIAALESAYKIAGGPLQSLSEEQVLECSQSWIPPTAGCYGGSVGPVFKYAHSSQLCTQASYPYTSTSGHVYGKCSMWKCRVGIPKGAVVGWKGLSYVAKILPTTEATMMSAVMRQPVSVGVNADAAVFKFYHGGVITNGCGIFPDHAVLVVGYGAEPRYGKYWKIKNSWGSWYGEHGFVRIGRGITWRGECAILTMPSYPVVRRWSSEVVV